MATNEQRQPSVRGRPRAFDRGVALQRAMEAFWRRGYAGVSIAELTTAMEISAPSLYAAFGSKAELFREAVALYRATHAAFARRALGAAGTAREALARLLHGAAIAYSMRERPRGCLIVSGATNCAVEDDPVVSFLAAERAATMKAIEARIRRAIAEQEIPVDADAAHLAAYFAAIVEGISVQARDGATRRTLHAVADTAMRAWPARSRGDGTRHSSGAARATGRPAR
jgi:TetR/AcrR family transcriptional regulator, copper-responsive repressor